MVSTGQRRTSSNLKKVSSSKWKTLALPQAGAPEGPVLLAQPCNQPLHQGPHPPAACASLAARLERRPSHRPTHVAASAGRHGIAVGEAGCVKSGEPLRFCGVCWHAGTCARRYLPHLPQQQCPASLVAINPAVAHCACQAPNQPGPSAQPAPKAAPSPASTWLLTCLHLLPQRRHLRLQPRGQLALRRRNTCRDTKTC